MAEAGGGSLLALGLLTPAAVSMLTGVMTNAIRHVHRQNGLWVNEGGVEYPVVILAVLAALADGGRAPSPSTRRSGSGFAARS